MLTNASATKERRRLSLRRFANLDMSPCRYVPNYKLKVQRYYTVFVFYYCTAP